MDFRASPTIMQTITPQILVLATLIATPSCLVGPCTISLNIRLSFPIATSLSILSPAISYLGSDDEPMVKPDFQQQSSGKRIAGGELRTGPWRSRRARDLKEPPSSIPTEHVPEHYGRLLAAQRNSLLSICGGNAYSYSSARQRLSLFSTLAVKNDSVVTAQVNGREINPSIARKQGEGWQIRRGSHGIGVFRV
jgi:hypothetical protein